MEATVAAEESREREEPIAMLVQYCMGWLAVIGAIAYLPGLIAGIRVMPMMSGLAWILIAFSLPATLLLLVGGIALIYRKVFGFYLVCIAILFGGIGGLGNPIIPGLKELVKGRYYAEDLALISNVLLLAILVWSHLVTATGGKRRAHFWATWVLIAVGAAHMGIVRSMIDRDRGTVETMEAVPYANRVLRGLKCTGPISYRSTYTKWQNSLSCVLSASGTEKDVEEFAAANGLKAAPIERREKMFPQTKGWKMDTTIFPAKFGDMDPCYVGRLKEHPRVIVQLGFKKSAGRVVVEVFGFLGGKSKQVAETR